MKQAFVKSVPIKYGIIGCTAGIASLFGYLLGREFAPGPYGKLDPGGPINTEFILEQYIAAALVGLVFFGLYAGTLSLVQRAYRTGAPTLRRLLAIGGTAVAVQGVVSVVTILLLRSQIGWNLDESISAPIEIAGFTLPGILAACVTLRMGRNATSLSGAQ